MTQPEPEECDACFSKNPVGGLKKYPVDRERGEKLLCQLCAGTILGTIVLRPDVHQNGILARGILQGLNLLRKDIAARGNS